MSHISPYWSALGESVAHGYKIISKDDLIKIMEVLNFGSMKTESLPGAELGSKKLSRRKRAEIKLVSSYWNLTENDLLATEKGWLESARKISGSSKDDGKDDIEDLVAPQIIARIISVAYLLYQIMIGEEVDDDTIVNQSIGDLNDFIRNACKKGQARITKVANKEGVIVTLYSLLVNRGIPVGSSGLYLPNPAESLPEILSMFFRDLNKEIYK